jgi:hypothetical protein
MLKRKKKMSKSEQYMVLPDGINWPGFIVIEKNGQAPQY